MCMSLVCDCYESLSCDFHAILCKFHKTPLRLPYVLCVCPAIATRYPHDQSEFQTTVRLWLELAYSHKRHTSVLFMDSAPDGFKI